MAVLSDGVNLPDDVANRMSLFYANPTPMLNTLSGAAEKLLQEVGSFWSCFILCLSHLPVLISFSFFLSFTVPLLMLPYVSCFSISLYTPILVGLLVLYMNPLSPPSQNPSLTLDNMTNCFSAMASVCRVIIDNP